MCTCLTHTTLCSLLFIRLAKNPIQDEGIAIITGGLIENPECRIQRLGYVRLLTPQAITVYMYVLVFVGTLFH